MVEQKMVKRVSRYRHDMLKKNLRQMIKKRLKSYKAKERMERKASYM